MPRRLWHVKLFCPHEGCKQVKLTSAGVYPHVHQVLDIDSNYNLAAEYLVCKNCLGNSSTQLRKKLMEQHTELWMSKTMGYLTDCEAFKNVTASPPEFADPPSFVPIPKFRWLLNVYVRDIKERLEAVKASITSTFGSVLKMDSTKKMVRKLAGHASERHFRVIRVLVVMLEHIVCLAEQDWMNSLSVRQPIRAHTLSLLQCNGLDGQFRREAADTYSKYPGPAAETEGTGGIHNETVRLTPLQEADNFLQLQQDLIDALKPRSTTPMFMAMGLLGERLSSKAKYAIFAVTPRKTSARVYALPEDLELLSVCIIAEFGWDSLVIGMMGSS
ncbi:Hypp6647 [Branchiostoma lanceolatum]|uniref:Hypp6647 protein n=1 Tax=Branchiostoma lanceolatum TaxID=7740 RepID=A0A8J9YVA5_BRALA|nr:Hypp6647 [Branchiostoma lanceolatum]